MRHLLQIVISFSMLASLAWAQAGDLVERSFTGTSSEKTVVQARRSIQELAQQRVSEDLIKELIGEDRFAKNKTMIQNKVIKLANRYIPFSKPGEVIQKGTQFEMTVTMKVSLKDLKFLLQENSLLAENETIPVVLPLVSFTDKVGLKTYRWWKPEDNSNKGFLLNQNRLFETALRGAFQRQQFFVIKAMSLGPQIPRSFQNERLSPEDMQFLAQYFGAPLMLEGQVQYSKSPEASNRYLIEVKMSALQVSNSRPIADVSRKFETEAGNFEAATDKKIREVVDATAQDLATQVFEAWQKGAIGTNILKLTFRGRIPLNQQEAFKEKLKNQVRDIRNIRERLLTTDATVYEIDTTVNAKDFVSKIQQLEIDGKRWVPVSQSDSEVILQLQR